MTVINNSTGKHDNLNAHNYIRLINAAHNFVCANS